MSDEREREIGSAAAKLRERGHLVEVSPCPGAIAGCHLIVDGESYTFHAFLDLVRSADVTA